MTDNIENRMEEAAVIIFRGKACACVPAGLALCPMFYPNAESQMDDAIILSALGGGMERELGLATLNEIAAYTEMRPESVKAAIERLGDKIHHDVQSGIYVLSSKFQVEREVKKRDADARRAQLGLGN